MENPDALTLAYQIADESSEIVKMLVIGYRANGSTFTLDTGLTVDQAKEMSRAYISWIDECIGRDIERASKGES